MPWLKSDNRDRAERKLRLPGFLDDEGGEAWLRLADALLPLPLASHFEVEPLPAAEELAGQRFGRVRGNESRIRQIARPRLSQSDEVVPIRAIAVKQNHKLFRRTAGMRREARAVYLNCHRGFLRNSSELMLLPGTVDAKPLRERTPALEGCRLFLS